MMKKSVMLLMVICMAFLTGCWDRIELNDVAIVTGLAVDRGKDMKYQLTVETVNAAQFSKNQMGGDASPAVTYSLEGNSVSELLHKMNVGLTRRLIFSHTRVLYISEEVAKEGVMDFLDYLDRSGQFRNDFNIVVTQGEKAEAFAKITYPVQKVPSLKLHKQTESFIKEWGGDPTVRLTDFISALTSYGRSPVSAAIKMVGDPEKGKKSENNQSTDVETLVEMNGMAIFKADKLIGYLDLTDTRNYYWTQKLKSTSLSVPCSNIEARGKDQKYNDLRVTETYTHLKVDLKNGRPVLKVKITGETFIEATQCSEDITKIDTYDKFEKDTNQFVANEIQKTIEKVQSEYGVDVFGFGEVFNRQHHKEYIKVEKNWDNVFSEADVKVEVDLHLRRSGIRAKSFISEMQKE
jgi:spore germination protein KC